MKIERIIGSLVAGLCVFCASTAFADVQVAVMKIEASGDKAEKSAHAVFEALRSEVQKSPLYRLDEGANDLSFDDMRDITGCDEKDELINCSQAACQALGAGQIIFGDVASDGSAKIIRFVCGERIYKYEDRVTDKTSAQNLARRVVEGEFGTVRITSNVDDVDVFVDGRLVETKPDPRNSHALLIELPVGNYPIAIQKSGYQSFVDLSVQVESGESTQLDAELSVDKTPKIRKGLRIGGWVSLGVGVAALVSGGALGALAQFKYNPEMNDQIKDIHSEPSMSFSDQNSRGKKMALSANVLYGVGGGLAAVGVTLVCLSYFYDFSDSINVVAGADSLVPTVDFQISPDYQGLTMGWTF